MIKLLGTVSVTELIIILCMAALALKELISILDFFWGRIKSIFIKEQTEEDRIKNLDARIDNLARWQEDHDQKTDNIIVDYTKAIEGIITKLDKQQEILDLLMASDRDDIKSWIVQQYHYFYEQKQCIDDFSKDVIEKRYAHYVAENGNSYVKDLMLKIRSLPSSPR